MKTSAIVAADVVVGADGVPWSPVYGDRYHPQSGALAQARHVFLAGNGLPGRWQGRRRFVVLETGFGLGNDFLAARAAWQADPQRCERLDFVSIEKHPPSRDALARLHAGSELAVLASELVAAWPPLTPNLHTLRFDGGRVRLLLALGDVADWLPQIVADVDAFFLDGFAPDRNPAMWSPRVCKALGRLAAPGATAATWTAARAVRDALQAAGFEVRSAAGSGGKRDITLASHVPPPGWRRPPRRLGIAPDNERQALIVGAGLAGCACAWALAEQGWTSRIVDRLPAPAGAASGNAGALFHGTVNAQDGRHARFNRAAALRIGEAVRMARERHGAAGAQEGLLRLETARDLPSMQAMLAALGLPSDYVQALGAAAAGAAAGLSLDLPAWFYPGGGWVDPAALARSYLERAGNAASFTGGVEVATLRRQPIASDADGTQAPHWQLLDGTGRVVAAAPVVVLANGCDALRLAAGAAAAAWPLAAVRGQATLLPADTPGLRLPALPLAGSGYLLPALPGGRALCGATSQIGDESTVPRTGDDLQNLQRLAVLTGSLPRIEEKDLQGRAGVRCVAPDRLPLIGGVPALPAAGDAAAPRLGLDQPRNVPRLPGLHVFAALASRGVTWSALGAEIAAAVISGAPCPVEADLLDAVDAARFASRAARRG